MRRRGFLLGIDVTDDDVLNARIDAVLDEVRAELLRAMTQHPTLNGPHEGWAVIREELDPELWEHVCGNTGRSAEARHEALQVAAMGVRYALDVCDQQRGEA